LFKRPEFGIRMRVTLQLRSLDKLRALRAREQKGR
jgi:hypothetical protein